MRPVQGRLILLVATLAANPALSEVCDKMRPDFPTGLGRIIVIDEIAEVFAVLLSPLGAIVMVLCLTSRVTGHIVPAVLTSLMAGGLGWIIWEDDKTDIWQMARQEGCAGDPILVYPALGLLAYFAIMPVIRRSRFSSGS